MLFTRYHTLVVSTFNRNGNSKHWDTPRHQGRFHL